MEREKEQIAQEKKALMMRLYQTQEQTKKIEQGETWIIFTVLHRRLWRIIIINIHFIE